MRYTRQEKSCRFSRTNADGTLITPTSPQNLLLAGLSGLSDTFPGSHVDYRAGIDYRFNPQLMGYLQVSTGFKGGGVNPRPYVPDQVRPFRPETLTTYEAGWKADLLGDAVRLNGAVFYNDHRDTQMTLYYCDWSASHTCGATAKAGDAHVRGAELEATIVPMRGLRLHVAGSCLDFRCTHVDHNTGVEPWMDALNNRWQTSVDLEYTANLGGAGTLTPAVDWSRRSASTSTPRMRPPTWCRASAW